jgi:TolB-like protein
MVMIGVLPGVRNLGAQNLVTLDEAITNAAAELGTTLSRGSKVAVLNFSGGNERFSNYVIEELTGVIVNQRLLTAVDRQQLDLVRKEINFQISGEVSDESAQEIGKLLGAQTIISGSMESIGNVYRIRFRAIEVLSATIQAAYSANIQNDSIVQALMGTEVTKGASAGSGPPAAPIIPAEAYQDFSTGRRVASGFLNWIYGLGSFTMGDWLGGSIILVTDSVVLALNLTNTGSVEMLYAAAGLLTGSVVFGFIRPFFFHRTRPKVSALDNFDIALVPGREGVEGVRFSYGFSY